MVAAVGIKLEEKWKQAEQRAHQQHTAVAVLHFGRVDHGVQQQTLCVYKDMSLISLDLFPGAIAVWVNRPSLFRRSSRFDCR